MKNIASIAIGKLKGFSKSFKRTSPKKEVLMDCHYCPNKFTPTTAHGNVILFACEDCRRNLNHERRQNHRKSSNKHLLTRVNAWTF